MPSELPNRKWLAHATPAWIRTDQARFFITICCQDRGATQLTVPEIAEAMIASIKFGHNRGDWFVHLALLMPDHLHAVMSFPSIGPSMSQRIALWKRLIAREQSIRWQRGFFDHRLRDSDAWDEKAFYIRMNPVRAELCSNPEDWPYVIEAPKL